MAVPNVFAAATGSIPLSQLDANFNTAITIGNTAVYLGNTTTTFGNVTINNATLNSGTIAASMLPTGSVLQVVQNATGGSSSTTSTTYVDVTNYSVSITPSSTSNKILIIASSKHQYTLVAATNVLSYQRLLRGSTALVDDVLFGAESSGGGLQAYGMITFSYLDSPSTTSSTTYKVQQHSGSASSTATTNSGWIIAMEIKA